MEGVGGLYLLAGRGVHLDHVLFAHHVLEAGGGAIEGEGLVLRVTIRNDHQGLGFRVEGSGFGVHGLKIRV